jgi:hypothetical protein
MVMEVNKNYNCDYYVHVYNKSFEEPGRSGTGGPINPEDVYLLEDALQMVYNGYRKSKMPTLDIVFETEEDFQRIRSNELKAMTEGWPRGKNPYAFFDRDTFHNILKMWHGQERVWELMEDGWRRKNQNCSVCCNSVHHYTRVVMLRLDVVYVTPIDVWKVRFDCDLNTFEGNRCPDVNNSDKKSFEKDLYFIDSGNKYAVIPGFSAFPVNDRMIYGPYDAVKVWASQRFQRAHSHVLETHMVNPINNQSVIIIPPRGPKGKGLHDETFVSESLLPAIKQEYGINVHVDPRIWFKRVRADGSIWILDAPQFKSKPNLGDPRLEMERKKLENVFAAFNQHLNEYYAKNEKANLFQGKPRQPNLGQYCNDVYKAKAAAWTGKLQIKCP